jgi:hypothetical protein
MGEKLGPGAKAPKDKDAKGAKDERGRTWRGAPQSNAPSTPPGGQEGSDDE